VLRSLSGGSSRSASARSMRSGKALLNAPTSDSARSDKTTPMADAAPLCEGDTLIIEAEPLFAERHKHDEGYTRVAVVPGSEAPELDLRDSVGFYAAVFGLVMMVIASSLEWMPILPLSIIIAFSLVAIGCITADQAWMCIKYRAILTIMVAFGLGSALDNTDVSDIIGAVLVQVGEATNSYIFLCAVFFLTALLACLVGSTPAIVLLYSSLRIVRIPGLVPGQILCILMLGAACSFSTPVGFATNLMVQARVGYKFSDFTLLGGVLTLTVGFTACGVAVLLPPSFFPATLTNTTSATYHEQCEGYYCY